MVIAAESMFSQFLGANNQILNWGFLLAWFVKAVFELLVCIEHRANYVTSFGLTCSINFLFEINVAGIVVQ